VSTLSRKAPTTHTERGWSRFSNLKDLSLVYEGRTEFVPVHPPDISPTGMFINTPAILPEGAVLKIAFRLAKSNYPINVRCEVRYCLNGVGIGVEFIGISLEDQKAILDELESSVATPRRRSRK
jgi:hypothetical protein